MCDVSNGGHTYLQLKDVRGQLLQTVFREVHVLQVGPPEDGDGFWKTLDLIVGGFVLFLQSEGRRTTSGILAKHHFTGLSGINLIFILRMGGWVLVWVPTSGQAQGSGTLLSRFLHTLRTLRDFRQCMTAVDRPLRQLSDTSSSCSLRRPIQLVPEGDGTPSEGIDVSNI